MATASINNALECSICFDSVKSPKILPCGHTFCLGCIERYIGNKTETVTCPICKQDVKIPEGGAKMFTNNYIATTSKRKTQERDQSSLTTKPKCPNHKQKEVDYYCNNCNVGLCLKCILGQHNDHVKLDIESDETRKNAIEKLQHSQNFIQNRIRNLEKSRSTLLESLEKLETLCEDSCAKVAERTEQIVSGLRKSCEQIIEDIRKNLKENRSKVKKREKEITSEIDVLNDTESNIPPSSKTTLNILLKSPRLVEIEKQDRSRNDNNLSLQYLQWVWYDYVSLGSKQLGFVVSKPFYIPSSYQFQFEVSELKRVKRVCYSKNKCRYNNVVWSCVAGCRSYDGAIFIDTKLLSGDNPDLKYCIIDGQISLLNIDDDSKTITKKYSDLIVKRDVSWVWNHWSWWNPITCSELTDTKNGYLTSSGQFVVQCDIKQIEEISWK